MPRSLSPSLIVVTLAVLLAGCVADRGPAAAPAPPDLLGAFEDDYGIRYDIDAERWHQHPGTIYHVVRWDSAGQFLIARNDSGNPGDGGKWTRIDWLRLDDMPPWRWAYCLTVWDAASETAALHTDPADRSNPRTGCGGFPFSRMRPVDPDDQPPGD